MIPPRFRAHDKKFLDGMTVGELTSELVLPIKRDWNELLGLDERRKTHRTVLSHDYGSVTSIILTEMRKKSTLLRIKTDRDVRGAGSYPESDQLGQVAPDSVPVIVDIDKFLQAAVTEVGQRLAVDPLQRDHACPGRRLSRQPRIPGRRQAHAGLGLNIPTLVPNTIKRYLPNARHFSIDDIQSANIPLWVRTTLQLIGTRSVLVAPFVFRDELLGVMGLHYCNRPHHWTETEVKLVEWLAGQVSIGLQYTRLYQKGERGRDHQVDARNLERHQHQDRFQRDHRFRDRRARSNSSRPITAA